MNPVITTLIGSIAAIGTTGAWLPQALKTWRTRSARDFSWVHLCMFSSGVALWVVYGALRRDAVIVTANAVTLLLVLTVMAVKLRE